MKLPIRVSVLCAVLALFFVGSAYAQTWNLPDSRRNNRFSMDLHDIVRPALTIRGFDNADLPSHYNTFDHSKVYGVKQVMERAYGVGMSQISTVESVLSRMIEEADTSVIHYSGLNKEKVENNASAAKTYAALALFTYIIDKNDGSAGEPNIFDNGKKALFPDMPSHNDALTNLMAFLTSPPSSLVYPDQADPFKTARSAMNLAQMWDMYLALENAYQDLDGNTVADQKLLNSTQKSAWNQRLHNFISDMYLYTTAPTVMYDISGATANVNKHEIQSGNWPLISFVACGYLTLGFNGTFPSSPFTKDDVLNWAYISSITQRNPSSGIPSRRYYFDYQTSQGKRYWAEGSYYFSVTLEHLIPYYHAMRANDWLPHSSSLGTLNDPFESPLFLNPVEWLADIATPQGYNPPIDDSNNYPIYPATMMNWSSAYGNSSTANVGAKYSHIVSGDYGRVSAFTLVELAMPRQTTIPSYPNQVYGGTDYTITENSEQQLVIKYTDLALNKHYVYLNGEHHDAVYRGEGHEQPDQNQLLYYINSTNHLVDPGYDYGQPVLNSSWNEYKYHNVMHHQYLRYYAPGLFHRYGGLESPSVRLILKRKDSDHNNIERLNVEYPASMPSKVVQLTGRVQLDVQNGGWPNYSYLASEYTRHVLFIKDKSYSSGTTPVYLVDFNSLKPRTSQDQSRYQWRMRYRSMGDYTSSPNGTTGWNAVIRSSTGEPSTHIYMSAAEFNPTTSNLTHFNEMIRQRDPTNSENIALDNVSGTHFNTMGIILPHQSQTLSYTPHKVPTHHPSLPAAAWVNQLSSDIIDVIALRGTNLMPHHAGFPVAFNVPAADNFQITLLSSRNFGFARLVRSGGVWALDPDYSVGIDLGTYSVAANANMTLNNAGLSSAYQVHVHDNASLVLTGSGTLSNKTFKMGNGSRIEIAGSYTFSNVTFEAFDPEFPWAGIEITANNNTFHAVTIRGAMDGVTVKSRNNNFSYCTIERNRVGIKTFESIPYYSTGRSSFSLADCQVLNNMEGMNLNHTNFHMVRTTVAYTDDPENPGDYAQYEAMNLNDAHAGSSSYDHFEDNTISGYLTGIYLWSSGSTLNMDPTAWGGGNTLEDNSFQYGQYEAAMATGTTLTIGDAMPNLSVHDPNTINGHTSPLRVSLYNGSTTVPLQAKYSRWNLNPTLNSSSIFLGSVNWSPFVNGSSFQSKVVAESGDGPIQERVHARIDELLEKLNDEASADARPEVLELLFTTMLLDDESRGAKAQEAEARLVSLSVEGGSKLWRPHEKEQLDRNLLRLALYRHDLGLAAERLDHASSRARHRGEISDSEADPRMLLAELELNMAVYSADYARALELLTPLREHRRMFMGEQHWASLDRHFDMLTRHYERMLEVVETPRVVEKATPKTNNGRMANGTEEMGPEMFAAYPNPFNPVTLIPVQLHQAGEIRMEVFDVLGRRVSVLADGPFQAGRHEIRFDAGRLSSGLYMIRTQLGGDVSVQRVTLVK